MEFAFYYLYTYFSWLVQKEFSQADRLMVMGVHLVFSDVSYVS